jgi:hypothetical protein
MGEDVLALDRYHHHGVPLDTKREVNVPADKMSLGFRRILGELVNG